MFGRRGASELLEEVLRDYQELAGSDIQQLRNRLPATEIWRIFVEKRAQQHGRHLELSRTFAALKDNKTSGPNPLNLTINQYIQQVEKINPDDVNQLKRSRLWRDLKKHRWHVDEEMREKFTLRDLLNLDKGWIPFDINEPGYLRGTVSAFQEIFNRAIPLDLNLIYKLHTLATEGVRGTNYDLEYEKRGGSRRSKTEMEFLLNKTDASEDGIKEFFDRKHPDQFIKLNIFNKKEWKGEILLNADSLALIRDFVAIQEMKKQPGVVIHNNFAKLKKYCEADSVIEFINEMTSDPILKEMIGNLGKTKNNEEVAYCLYQWIEKRDENFELIFVSSQANAEGKLSEALENELKQYIAEYENSIAEKISPVDKLRVIIKFIQACELLHPFHDANGRTFCMLLLNHLLIKEGFPLAILTDSNHFNLYSQDEMLRDLIKGMSNTMKLLKQGKLFEVDTQEIVRVLQSKSNFSAILDTFREVVAIEEQGRRVQYSPEFKHQNRL